MGMIMPVVLLLASLVVFAIPSSLTAQEKAALRRDCARVAGRIHHLAFDGAGEGLFIAELGNNSVGAVSLEKRAATNRVTGLSEPQELLSWTVTGRSMW